MKHVIVGIIFINVRQNVESDNNSESFLVYFSSEGVAFRSHGLKT